MKNTKVIFTALTKGYDELKQPPCIHGDYDYICFSNDFPEKRIGVWQIRSIPYSHEMPVRTCRFVKMNPHLLLPNYEYSLWLDANQTLAESHYLRTDELIRNGSICAMVLHPERDCVYQEAYCLTGALIDDPQKVYDQTKFLIGCHFPERAGLFVTCCVFRKHNDLAVIAFSNIWWKLCKTYSYRDQMGVTFALSEAKICPDIFQGRNYWKLFRNNHSGTPVKYTREQTFLRLLKSYYCVARLKLLFARYGIKNFDWRKNEIQ